jgi:hypothetical protein
MLEINGIVAAALLVIVLCLLLSKERPKVDDSGPVREHPDYDDARSLRNRSERSEDWLNG